MLRNFLQSERNELWDQVENMWSQRDGATVHASKIQSMNVLREMIPGRQMLRRGLHSRSIS